GNAQQMLTLEREAFTQGVEIGVRQAEVAGLQHIGERIDFKRAGAFTTILDEQLEQLNRCANRRNIHELNSAAKRTGYRFFLEDAGDCLRVRRKLAYNQRDFVKRITFNQNKPLDPLCDSPNLSLPVSAIEYRYA